MGKRSQCFELKQIAMIAGYRLNCVSGCTKHLGVRYGWDYFFRYRFNYRDYNWRYLGSEATE